MTYEIRNFPTLCHTMTHTILDPPSLKLMTSYVELHRGGALRCGVVLLRVVACILDEEEEEEEEEEKEEEESYL